LIKHFIKKTEYMVYNVKNRLFFKYSIILKQIIITRIDRLFKNNYMQIFLINLDLSVHNLTFILYTTRPKK
jgi:hypothetical protein